KDLVDYNTYNGKITAVFHYKIKPDVRLVYASNFGTGTTVYQGDNRYSLKDVLFFQNRIELTKDNKFFIRAYATNENSGNSYDAYFTALLLEKAAKGDIPWGTDYANYWSTHVAPKIQGMEGYPSFTFGEDFLKYLDSIKLFLQTIQPELAAYHQQAEDYANNQSLSAGEHSFYVPGTAAFDSAFHSIISRESYSE